MDASAGLIADYAHALRYSDLPASAVLHCKRCVVDTFGVALGAFDAEPSRIGRKLAQRASVASGARILGTAHRTLPELAAFANGVMTRYLDGNDAYPGGGGHPSDAIAAILAAAEIKGANGKDIITAITLAYEVFYNLWTATHLRHKGMDNVFYGAVAGAVGAAKVMGLNRAQIAEAVALAIVPNISLDATRYGHLSMWKGCAAGNAARNGVFAALLAAEGITGPDACISGDHGLEKLCGKITLAPFAGAGRPYRIGESTLKCFLSEGHSLSPITAALDLSTQLAFEDIEKVVVYTYWFAWDVIGREPEKWRPTTRETADHSLPYIIAAVLIDRSFSDEIFSDERLRDPRIRQLIDRVEVREDKELTARFPQYLACRVEVTNKDGTCKVARTDYPRGHPKNPMTDEEINVKFRGLAHRALAGDRIDNALDTLWKLESAENLDAIFDAVQTSN